MTPLSGTRLGRALAVTRSQGAALDVVAGLGLGLAAGRLAGSPRVLAALGLLAGLLCALRWSAMRAARALQRRRPALGSAVEALLEGQGGILRGALQQWVEERAAPVFLPGSAARAAGAWMLAAVAALAPSRSGEAKAHSPPPPPDRLVIRTHVEPPAYSGQGPFDVDGETVVALRGSRAQVQVVLAAPALLVSEAGLPERRVEARGGKAILDFELDVTRTVRLSPAPGGPPSIVRLEAVPDRPPEVVLVEPLADRAVTAAPRSFAVRASARDDIAVRDLALRWTLAQGRGEGMKFRNGRLRGTETANGGTTEVSGRLDPVALGMRQGDTLIVWAEASDGNRFDGPGRSRSAARILRWDEPIVELRGLHGGVPLPPPQSLLTEREILARTERLVRQRLRGKPLRERALDLADDQRKLRTSFGFFLQAESGEAAALDVDDKELAESGDARARRRLADAVSFMWEAESALSVGNPAAALAPERSAVKALDDAFGLVRLALRPGAPPDKPVDESRRLRGDQRKLRPAPGIARPEPSPRRTEIARLARQLLLDAQEGVSAEAARALGDRLWGLSSAELPAAELAAGLYAAADGPARSSRARAAGEALARWLRPSPVAIPPREADEADVLQRVPVALP